MGGRPPAQTDSDITSDTPCVSWTLGLVPKFLGTWGVEWCHIIDEWPHPYPSLYPYRYTKHQVGGLGVHRPHAHGIDAPRAWGCNATRGPAGLKTGATGMFGPGPTMTVNWIGRRGMLAAMGDRFTLLKTTPGSKHRTNRRPGHTISLPFL